MFAALTSVKEALFEGDRQLGGWAEGLLLGRASSLASCSLMLVWNSFQWVDGD